MKKVLLSLAFLSLTGFAFAQEKGVRFEQGKSWDQIKAKAKAENKFIFMDVFATWCGPCKMMDKVVYPSENLGSFINQNFISVKVQADQTKDDNENVKSWYDDAIHLIKKYNINGYPYLLFFSPEGNLISQSFGYSTESDLIKLSTKVVEKSKQYLLTLEDYNSQLLQPEQIKALVLEAKSLGDFNKAKEIADKYIDNYLLKLNNNDLYTKENLIFIGNFIGDIHSKAYHFFVSESEKINSILGFYQAQYAIMKFVDRKYLPQPDSWKTSKPEWNKLYKSMKDTTDTLGQEVVLSQEMMYYLDLKDWVRFGALYMKYLSVAFKHPRYDINYLSWSVFEKVSDQTVLKFACDVVMKYAMEEWYQNVPEAYDTYANLLYKTGRTKKAIEWQDSAVKMAKGTFNEKSFIETLRKMQAAKPTWVNLN